MSLVMAKFKKCYSWAISHSTERVCVCVWAVGLLSLWQEKARHVTADETLMVIQQPDKNVYGFTRTIKSLVVLWYEYQA